MSTCDQIDSARDYALDELGGAQRQSFEQHLAQCEECAAEIEELRIATSALRILPDREIPQRIAFVSDKVFQPSAFARFFGDFWNSAARLGFASACVLSAALIVNAARKPAEVRIAAGPTRGEIAAQVNTQVNDAVKRAVAEVRVEDAKLTQAAVEAANAKSEKQYRALLVAMDENLTILQKRFTTSTMLASNDAERFEAGR